MEEFKIIQIDLQLFAGDDKTEKGTAKKREDARNKGQVLHSREITASIVLISLIIGISIFGSDIYNNLAIFTKKIFTDYFLMDDFDSIGAILKLYLEVLLLFTKTLGPIFAIAIITIIFVNVAQTGFLFTLDTLGVKFDRINPLSGFKRLVSMKSIVELFKALFKISIIGLVAYSYVKGKSQQILNLMGLDVLSAGIFIANTAVNVALRICIVLVIMAVFDYIYQWFEYEKSMKMSKQEIKDEYKQIEGNPEVKAKIKQKQRQMSMGRMLQEVPKADVVITNPTHFAVAIKYDILVSAAPIVLAKGQDFIALRIKETAKENGVQIVENKALARAIYASVDIGKAIPADLYQAVAEVLAFVYNLKGKGKVG